MVLNNENQLLFIHKEDFCQVCKLSLAQHQEYFSSQTTYQIYLVFYYLDNLHLNCENYLPAINPFILCRLQNKVVTIKSWFTISDLNDVIVSFYSLEDFFNIEALQVKVYVIFCCEVPEYANAILISLWHCIVKREIYFLIPIWQSLEMTCVKFVIAVMFTE